MFATIRTQYVAMARSPWWAVAKMVLRLGVVGAVFGILAAHPNLPVSVDPSGESLAAQTLVQQHGCWSGMAPTGAIAHHVVITLDGHDQPTYGGQRLTDRALEQVLFNGAHVGQVWGFCR